jgi:hypothetical protein
VILDFGGGHGLHMAIMDILAKRSRYSLHEKIVPDN